MLQVHTVMCAVTAKHVHTLEAYLVAAAMQNSALPKTAQDMSYAAWWHQHTCHCILFEYNAIASRPEMRTS